MRLLRSVGIIIFGNVGGRVLSFGSKLLLARILTATELGGWQLLQTWYLSLSGPFIGVIQTVVTQLVASRSAESRQRPLLIASGIYCFCGFGLLLLPMLLLPQNARPEGSDFFYQVWRILLPSYVLTVPVQVLKGWLMGQQRMEPVVFNQWLEQLIEIIGMALIWHLQLEGFIPLIVAFLVADAVALLHLIGCWLRYGDAAQSTDSPTRVWGEILHHGAPHSISRGVHSLGRIGEAGLIPPMLIASGASPDEALGLYGQFGALAMPTLNMPSLLIVSLATALLPEAAREKDVRRRQRLIRRGVSIALLLGLPIGIFFSFEGVWLGELLFASREVGEMIAMLAPTSLLVYVDIVASQLLRAIGGSLQATMVDIFSFAVRLFLLYLAALGSGGFAALTQATIISSFIGALLSLYLLLKEAELTFAWREWLWWPLAVALPFTAILLLPVAATQFWLHLGKITLAFLFLGLATLRVF